jgi:hypothetical protein
VIDTVLDSGMGLAKDYIGDVSKPTFSISELFQDYPNILPK